MLHDSRMTNSGSTTNELVLDWLWNDIPSQAFYARVEEVEQPKGAAWELVHQPSGVGVREWSDFQVSAIALWGLGHVVSPEVFIQIAVQPGETQCWSRRYEFFAR